MGLNPQAKKSHESGSLRWQTYKPVVCCAAAQHCTTTVILNGKCLLLLWFALGTVAFLPAGCVQSRSTKFKFFWGCGHRDTWGCESPYAHRQWDSSAERSSSCMLLHGSTAAGTDALQQKLWLGHQNSKVQLRLYLKWSLREFVPLDKLGPTILYDLVWDAGKPEHVWKHCS